MEIKKKNINREKKKKKQKNEKKRNNNNNNKAGYTAQDAPRTRTFHLRKQHGTDGRTYGPTDDLI